jgi:hypothetical protein
MRPDDPDFPQVIQFVIVEVMNYLPYTVLNCERLGKPSDYNNFVNVITSALCMLKLTKK